MTKWLQVRLCRQKTSGKVYAMKKLKKAEMVRRGQVRTDCDIASVGCIIMVLAMTSWCE